MFNDLLEECLNEGVRLESESGVECRYGYNWWTWRAILALIEQIEVLPAELIHKMGFNDCMGPNAEQARELADMLQPIADQMESEERRVSHVRSKSQRAKMKKMGAPSYSVGKDELQAFIDFARRSEGFEVC